LADADLNKAIVSGVLRCEPSIDFLTSHAAGLYRLSDREVLALVAEQRRVLVSHDVNTLPGHFRFFRNAGRNSSGVFLVSQSLAVNAAIDELRLVWMASEAREWENRLVWLPI
jgi:hypothetical protein